MVKYYNYLLGKEIVGFENCEDEFIFYTDDEKIIMDKFVPYCACYVGEYIDEITWDGKIKGIITNISYDEEGEEDLDPEFDYGDTVYKGNVSFYFENGKVNMNVHGEDNGFYGVQFTMPVTIVEREKKKDE